MLDIAALFPCPSDAMSQAFEAAPKSLLAVSAAIDYKEALSLTDPRYVSTTNARAEKFEHRFYSTFGYHRGETGGFVVPATGKHVLFFGHVGCGKSTELTQMCAELHHPDRYWVVRVNLLDLIDPNDARYSDVWLAVAQQLITQLLTDQVAVTDVVLSRLQRWFTERILTNDQVKEFAAEIKTVAEVGGGIPLVGKLLARFTSAIKTGSTHRESLRTVVRNTYGEFVGALNQLIIDVTAEVQRVKKGQQILFAIDGTDRFRGEDWQRFFVDDANQLTLVKCIAVYTAPMALKSSGARLDLFEAIVLPMVKLHEFDEKGARREGAYSTMRAVLLKRCHHSLFDTVETLDTLIDFSGGHLRDMLRLLAYACIESEVPVLNRAAIDAAAQRLAGDYRDWLRSDQYPVLVAAACDPENTGTSELITRLVDGGALLEYNTGSWRKPHPVVKLLTAYRRAEAALLAA
ncbi:MAG: ATP-binding protein [Ramlibacter sp.]|nr:ATP-binding protein [Ramlibacter sp.]